jgi:hypothetical protein
MQGSEGVADVPHGDELCIVVAGSGVAARDTFVAINGMRDMPPGHPGTTRL